MIKTKTTTFKSYDEWDKDTQETIREKHQYINTEYHDWWEWTIEDFKTNMLEKYWCTVDDVQFTWFYSQWDGASFTWFIDVDKWAKERLKGFDLKMFNEVREKLLLEEWEDSIDSVEITRGTSRYVHENTCNVDISNFTYCDNLTQRDEEVLEELRKDIEEWRVEMCHDLYRKLEEEQDYLMSEECLSETFEANEYLFDEEWNIY